MKRGNMKEKVNYFIIHLVTWILKKSSLYQTYKNYFQENTIQYTNVCTIEHKIPITLNVCIIILAIVHCLFSNLQDKRRIRIGRRHEEEVA